MIYFITGMIENLYVTVCDIHIHLFPQVQISNEPYDQVRYFNRLLMFLLRFCFEFGALRLFYYYCMLFHFLTLWNLNNKISRQTVLSKSLYGIFLGQYPLLLVWRILLRNSKFDEGNCFRKIIELVRIGILNSPKD